MIRRWKANWSRRLDDHGLSLIEVMIAIFVFSVVALAVSSMTVKTWQTTDLAKSYTEASTLAAQNLESMFSAKYASNEESGMNAGITEGIHTFDTPDGRYNISYEIRDNDALPNTKSVQMTVSFIQGQEVKKVRYNYLLPLRK